MKLLLPETTSQLIKHYLNLKIGNKIVSCPYFQNVTNKRFPLAVFSGKGTPEQIEKASEKAFVNGGRNISEYSADVIRFYMTMSDIGVDCSGFTARIIESLLAEKGKGVLQKNLLTGDHSPLGFLRFLIRPVANLSANSLTGSINCISIKETDMVLPGDLIRIGSHHVAIVGEVEKEGNYVTKITYYHSTYDYYETHGVRKGQIVMTKPGKDLSKQRWTEFYRGRNWMLEDYLNVKPSDRGIRRLKTLSAK